MMKILGAFTSCIFLINCADVFSQDSPEGLWCPRDVPSGINASAEPECYYDSNITCPSGQGCCGVSDRINYQGYFYLCVDLNEEPADCINDSSIDGVSLKHGEKISTCGSNCFCFNGMVNCGEAMCFRPGDILVIGLLFIAIICSTVIAVLVCMCVNSQATQREDNPPPYKKAVRMPPTISGTISDDGGLNPPSYEQAVNIASENCSL